MKKIAFFFLFIYSLQNAPANDGYHRKYYVDVLHYEFYIALNDSTDRIEGRAKIQVRFVAETDSISFDLTGLKTGGKGMSVTNVTDGSRKIKWEQGKEKLIVFLNIRARQNDTLEFNIEYNGIPADGLIISKNKFGNRTFFADNWPNRAHNYLPCVDHPYDKASVDFIVLAPDKYKVVGSGILVEESNLPGPMTLTHWSESVPLATKVMTFGAAEFAVKYAGGVNSIPVWSWVFPENRMEGFFDYSIAVKPLEYYSNIIGAYPYKKLANVQSKTIYGGLENGGTIFYSERSVTGLGKAEGLIAHEIAHQWFGDCVTEADWYHIWLSEGFATYLTSLYFESVYGRNRLESDMKSTRQRVLDYYEKNQKPVVDTTVTDLMDLLNVNSYQKGAWVLHMLRYELGDKLFMKGLCIFYERFYNGNALTEDFKQVMEEVSGKNLDNFFQQWLYTAGQPELVIRTEKSRKNGITDVYIEQKQITLFVFSLELLIRDNSGERIEKVAVKERVTKLEVQSKGEVLVTPDPNINLLFRQRE
jgi:aminopeptidase N